MVLKSEQEESIFALKKAVAMKRQAPIVNIKSPVSVSQSTSSSQSAVRTWAAQLRMIRHQMEDQLQQKMPIRSALMTWLVAWSAEVKCRHRIQADGRNCYEYVTGHKGLQPIAISVRE